MIDSCQVKLAADSPVMSIFGLLNHFLFTAMNQRLSLKAVVLFDLHGASNTHLKETDKYFVYCVQGTEIQPVISDVFKSYWEQ